MPEICTVERRSHLRTTANRVQQSRFADLVKQVAIGFGLAFVGGVLIVVLWPNIN